MKRENFTAERVASYHFKPSPSGGSNQTTYWDSRAPGLGLRVTKSGEKSYIFQTKLDGRTIRITIGSPKTWLIGRAQAEATRLKAMTDQGIDPRQVRSDKAAEKRAAIDAQKAQVVRETVTVGGAWAEYVEVTQATWGELHRKDHARAMQPGGEIRKRSSKLTQPGPLASLAPLRLMDITPDRLVAWAKIEGAKRPTRARNGRTLLSTFLNWCIAHPIYGAIVTANPTQGKDIRKYLGRPTPKNDALQREQLPAWFEAVRQVQNPAMSAYMQALLLAGARPNELITLKWEDVDFQWHHLTIKDKVAGQRVIPLPPYTAHLLAALPRRNEWVFSSLTSVSGHLVEPRTAHSSACAIAGVNVTLHGLRRSFASLCEWIEMPAGIAAQIQGHKPQGVREQHYIRRPLDLLRMWHVKIEAWILEQAEIDYAPAKAGLHIIKS